MKKIMMRLMNLLHSPSGGQQQEKAAAQFDVEGVLNAIAQHASNRSTLTAGLLEFFDEVHDLDNSVSLADEIAFSGFALDLWADDQPYATLRCEIHSEEAVKDMLPGDTSMFAETARTAPQESGELRFLYSLDYWDPEGAVKDFIAQVSDWCSQHIAPLKTEDDPAVLSRHSVVKHDLVSTGQPWALTVTFLAAGQEAQARIEIVTDLPGSL